MPERYSRFVPPAFGVTVFFVLSGYLITTLLRREFAKAGRISLKDFYIRRVLRIWPPFYIVLALSTLLTVTGVLSGNVSFAAVLAYSAHIANYWRIYHGLHDSPSGTNVYWSLGVEEHFYLLFPIFYVMLRKLGLSALQQLSAILALASTICLWRVVLVFGYDADLERIGHATDTRVDAILVGCALAVYSNPALDITKLSRRTWCWILLPISLVALVAANFTGHGGFHLSVRYLLQALLLWAVFTVAVRYPDFGPMRLLNLRPLRFLGTLSYTFYLSHRAILFLFEEHTSVHWIVQALLALIATILFAYLMQIGVEVPCSRLRRRYSRA